MHNTITFAIPTSPNTNHYDPAILILLLRPTTTHTSRQCVIAFRILNTKLTSIPTQSHYEQHAETRPRTQDWTRHQEQNTCDHGPYALQYQDTHQTQDGTTISMWCKPILLHFRNSRVYHTAIHLSAFHKKFRTGTAIHVALNTVVQTSNGSQLGLPIMGWKVRVRGLRRVCESGARGWGVCAEVRR